MGLFDFLGNGRAISGGEHRERKSRTNQVGGKSRAITSTDVFGATVGDADVDSFIEEGYQLNPYVHRAIRLIASSVASLSIGLYEGRERPNRITETTAAQIIERPNPHRGGKAFMQALVTKLLINGEVYPELTITDGAPREMYVIADPQDIDPVVNEQSDGLIERFESQESGETWSPREMHQIRLLNPKNDFRGQSAIRAAARAADVSNYGRKYMHALLKAHGVPPYLVQMAAKLGPEEQEQFEERFAERTLSAYLEMRADGLPKPQLMDGAGDVDFERLGFSPSEMELLPTMQQAAREVAVAMGPAPELLGDPENKVYNNVAEARQALYHETAIPLAEKIAGELTNWLGPQFGLGDSQYYGFTTKDVAALQGDPHRKRELDLRELEAGAITVNEYRERQGMPKQEGADVLLVPKSKQPLAVAREPESETEPQPQ